MSTTDLRCGPDNSSEERVHNEFEQEMLERIKNGDFRTPRTGNSVSMTPKMKEVERKFSPRYGADIKEVIEYFYVQCGLTIPNVAPLLQVEESTVWHWMKKFEIPIHNSCVSSGTKTNVNLTDQDAVQRLVEARKTGTNKPHLCGMPQPIKNFCSKCAVKECAYCNL